MKKTISFIWLFILFGTLAYVFILTGCAPAVEVGAGMLLNRPRTVQGERGLPGGTGARGSDGLSIVGPPGPAGLDGADGTVITFVNLCPGVTSYPGVFVEVAMCVNGDLYGVYSANGGFMTYLPPGTYHSNAIGSACNLTIGSNCAVSH